MITVMQIHLTEPPGDVLVFLPGRREIRWTAERLAARRRQSGTSVLQQVELGF